MPSKRKRKGSESDDESDEEYQEDPSAASDDDNDDDEEGEVEAESKPAAKARSPARAKKKAADIVVIPDDQDEMPSHARLTERGGYAHTTSAKLRISMANKGNTAWNKGKNRSGADKAKISAAVRARNRALLLDKLKKIGMTEEEHEATKTKIKYARERLRRTKVANRKRVESEGRDEATKEEDVPLMQGDFSIPTMEVKEHEVRLACE